MVVVEADVSLPFASADEETKTIEANDNISASIFFIPLPISQKKKARRILHGGVVI
jgi:hypothetical protein